MPDMMAIFFPSSLVIFLLTIVGATWYFLTRSSNASRAPLPPGPNGVPLLGNLNDLPKPGEQEPQHWLKHKDLYGTLKAHEHDCLPTLI